MRELRQNAFPEIVEHIKDLELFEDDKRRIAELITPAFEPIRKSLIPTRMRSMLRFGSNSSTTKLNARLIASSSLFDRDWYLAQYADVRRADVDPVLHYLQHGASEGRDPSLLFDTDWYLQQNLDVLNSGTNPLVHYLKYGAAEGRDPTPSFRNGAANHAPETCAAN